MQVCWVRKIERAQVMFKDSEGAKVIAWLMKKGFVPTEKKKPLNRILKLNYTPLKGKKLSNLSKCKNPFAIVPGWSLLTVEKDITRKT